MRMLSDLPKDVQDVLRPLSREQFKDLADFFHIERMHEAERALPTDPEAAIEGIFKTLWTQPAGTDDTAQETLVNLLAVLRLVLANSGHDGIDAADTYPLWELADRAHDMALHAREQRRIAMDYCRRVRTAETHAEPVSRKK